MKTRSDVLDLKMMNNDRGDYESAVKKQHEIGGLRSSEQVISLGSSDRRFR